MKKTIAIGIAVFLACLIIIPSASADWLDGWDYRKTINITGQSGAGTYYQVNFSIGNSSGGDFHLEGHCTDFPNDTVVTDDDGVTKLPFWIEDPTADPIQMWVNVSDDLNTSQDVCVYYGKSGESSVSNGTNTFEFFDDFEGTEVQFSILNTTELGSSSCAGGSDIWKAGDEDYWVIWQYSPTSCEHAGPNFSRAIYYPNNQTYDEWDDDYVLSDGITKSGKTFDRMGDPTFRKMDNIYFVFLAAIWTDGTKTFGYKNSSTGNPQSFDNWTMWADSSSRIPLSCDEKINDTEYWIVYNYDNGSTYYLAYRTYNTSTETFSSENIINSSASFQYYLPEVFKDPDSNRVLVFYSDVSDSCKHYVMYTDNFGSSWSSATYLNTRGDCPTPMVKLENTYYRFYRDDGDSYKLKIRSSSDGVTESAFQTLHTTVYSNPHTLMKLNDTHIILNWQEGSCSSPPQKMQVDLLELTTTTTCSDSIPSGWSTVTDTGACYGHTNGTQKKRGFCSVYCYDNDGGNSVSLQRGELNIDSAKAIEFDARIHYISTGGDTNDCLSIGLSRTVTDVQSHPSVYGDGNVWGYFDGSHHKSGTSFNLDQWYKITIIHNFTAQTFDFYVDDVLALNDAGFYGSNDSADILAFWSGGGPHLGNAHFDSIRIRKYTSPEPAFLSAGSEESAHTIPPNPTNLQNTTGNFWVNYTWDAGSGIVTNSYNVSNQTEWFNGTTNTFYNESVDPSEWVNITVYAWNSSGAGNLSEGSVSDQVQVSAADTTFTVSLPIGYTKPVFEPPNSTATNYPPNGQTDSQEFYNVTNSGNVNLDVRMRLNTTVSTITLKADADNNPTGADTIGTSLVTIHSGLGQGSSVGVWLWSDFDHTPPQTANRTIYINVSQT